MAKANKIPFLYTSLLYLCGFFLFLEWLYPIGEFTDIRNLSIFIIYAVFCFLISAFDMRWWITMLIKALGLLLIIRSLFINDPLWGDFSFQALYVELSTNLNSLFSGNWYQITDIFRSIMFFLLIWMISYLIYYWFIVMKRILLFILLTFIYITLVDTFTYYDASFTIIRIFMISFIALGMANIFKVIEHQQIAFSWVKNWQRWMIPIMGIVFLTALVGYFAPKYGPQWPDPVPFLRGEVDYNRDEFGNSGNRSGYGDDDSRLGGSFQQDDTTVFHAITKHREYWRIETKEIYTGKGWEGPSKKYGALDRHLGSLKTFSENVAVEENKAWVEFKGNTPIDKLVYPYGLSDIQILEGPELQVDRSTGAIQKQAKSNQVNEERYQLVYDKPLFDLEMLRSTSEIDPQDILEQYTKLPETLPDRIGELAKEITESTTNRFDQAQAIERYFGRSGFVYETEDVPFPAEDQDYVDQFLFETQAGYCDNYSTAMVVMLRTLDIPARWVKGFTGGERIANQLEEEELFDIYEITNANAHSWVEVYFPEIGWVPFEPTQGFINPIDFVEESEEVEDQVENDDYEEELDTEEQETPEEEIPEQEEQSEENSDAEVGEEQGTKVSGTFYLSGFILLMVIVSLIVYFTRFRWKPALLYASLKNNHDYQTYEKAYHHLLMQLEKKGIAKDPSQSLREYAAYVDEKFNTKDMSIITSYYENLLYNKQNKIKKDNEWIELWKNFMKHIQNNPRHKG